MKNLKFISIILLAFMAFSCKKENTVKLATITTAQPSNLSTSLSNWKSGGNITDSGGAPITARGVCWSTTENPTTADLKTTDGSGAGVFTSGLFGLSKNTTYHVRAYATNSAGTAYGNDLTFTTLNIIIINNPPTLSTLTPYIITGSTSGCGGINIFSSGSAITAKGVCWSTSANPTIADAKTTSGTGNGDFNSYISGLTYNTTYHVRAYATNSAGTGYGNDLSFTTKNEINDIDGNVYSVVKIGTQYWLKENLRTMHYNDGTTIQTNLNNTNWASTNSGASAIYDDKYDNLITYGRLYNWYAVKTGKLAPAGWHVPTDAEWKTLTDYLGGVSVAGGAMKATTLWNSPNTGATNSSGFTGLPAGTRFANGTFGNMGYDGSFWSSTESSTDNAWYRTLFFNESIANRFNNLKRNGYSVRCVKD